MINVTKTYAPDLEKFQFYVKEIFKSGWFTNNGMYAQLLQERLSEYLGVSNLLLVSNGTLALQLAYELLGFKGSVITTPFSFVATTSSLVWEGCQPVFADIDENTLNIDPVKVEAQLNDDITGIVATHVYGNACDVDRIQWLANTHQIGVVYDAAHAFGVRIGQESLLKFGDISVLSFHSTKVFHTIEGGALIIKDDNLYEKAKKMINFGIESPDRISMLGINCKMNEFQAAMGLCMLDEVDNVILERSKRYQRYESNLGSNRYLQRPRRSDQITNNYSHYPVVLPDEETLVEVVLRLKERDIVPRRYFYPSLNKLPYLKTRQSTPISEDISARVLCLPLFHDLGEAEQDLICEIVEKTLLHRGYIEGLTI